MVADIGFLGGGQLARMSIQAAQRMGLSCISLDPAEKTPASQVAPAIVGQLADPDAIASLLRSCRYVTLENEFIPAHAIRQAFEATGLSEQQLTPGIESLAIIQDKLLQRQVLEQAGVPVPKAVALTSAGEAITLIGFPMVLKARFGGYDGKGTRIARNEAELLAAMPSDEHAWLAEEFVPFRREIAVMVARNANQHLELEVVETQQKDFVCDVTYPARLWSEATDPFDVPLAAIEAINGFGLFGVELFELEDGSVLVNEIAPRPHNTGHYSLDWGDLSQFSIHIRLVLGLPLPKPSDHRLKGKAVYMANLLGQEGAKDYKAGIVKALEIEPSARIHWYGKEESRPGRKMGHINVVARRDEPPHAMLPHLNRVRNAFYDGWIHGL